MDNKSGTQRKREPIEISPEEARQEAPAPRHRRKSGGTPGALILLYGAGLTLLALALWAFLLLVRF